MLVFSIFIDTQRGSGTPLGSLSFWQHRCWPHWLGIKILLNDNFYQVTYIGRVTPMQLDILDCLSLAVANMAC